MTLDDNTPLLRSRTREVALGVAVVALLAALLALLTYGAATDQRAAERLPEPDRAALIHAECESLRLVCQDGQPTSACVERAKLLQGLDGVDDDCRSRAAAIAAPRR